MSSRRFSTTRLARLLREPVRDPTNEPASRLSPGETTFSDAPFWTRPS